jgi:hypothetical protein
VSGAEIVALSSVVTTGLVALVTQRLGRSREELQTRRAREDELRAVLEHAGVKLSQSIFLLDEARNKLGRLGPDDLDALAEDLQQLWLNHDRLAVRLGSNAREVQLYHRAITEGVGPAHSIVSEAAHDTLDGDGRDALMAARNIAIDVQPRFYDAASARVGPDAPI